MSKHQQRRHAPRAPRGGAHAVAQGSEFRSCYDRCPSPAWLVPPSQGAPPAAPGTVRRTVGIARRTVRRTPAGLRCRARRGTRIEGVGSTFRSDRTTGGGPGTEGEILTLRAALAAGPEGEGSSYAYRNGYARAQPRCCAAAACCDQVASPRTVRDAWATLRIALGNAVREELFARNVAGFGACPQGAVALPLPEICTTALKERRERQDEWRDAAGSAWQGMDFVISTRYGLPVEPRNFHRDFKARCAKAGVRPISVHSTRRTCASLLVALDVHPRVAMQVLTAQPDRDHDERLQRGQLGGDPDGAEAPRRAAPGRVAGGSAAVLCCCTRPIRRSFRQRMCL